LAKFLSRSKVEAASTIDGVGARSPVSRLTFSHAHFFAMSPPEDSLQLHQSWFNRWFESPWQALLTWGVLAGVGEAVWEPAFDMSYAAGESMAFFFKLQVPNSVTPMLMVFHGTLISSWFVPFALQLSLRRAFAWYGVEVGSGMLWLFFVDYFDIDLWQIHYLLRPIALALVLHRWRSRPWMCLVSAGLVWFAWELMGRNPGFFLPAWSWTAFFALLFAAPLLFGTRLLRPALSRGN
jgi:hypothetical protein